MSSSAGPSRLASTNADNGIGSASVLGSNSSDDNAPLKNGPGSTIDVLPFMRRLTDLLDAATTNASALPPRSDLSFHRTLDRKFAKDQDEAGNRLLKLADRLLGAVHSDSAAAKGKARRKVEDEDDVVDGYRRSVLDVVNGLLEDAAINLDAVNGEKKAPAISVLPSARANARGTMRRPNGMAQAIPKPQDGFSSCYHLALRNRDVFRPEMESKPHALVSFEIKEIESYSRDEVADAQLERASQERGKQDNRQRFEHPYRYETEHLGYPTSMFIDSPPIDPLPLKDPDMILVDTPAAYQAMVEQLLQAKEIAVDLEHHHIRSYYGFTCLMQISTRRQDWIVDVIALRDLLYEDKLGGVLVDPSVIKVFHGADQDVTWLQKDFQIYIVNLFDTHQAAAFLAYPQRSLKALVAKFCGIKVDKTLQLADWRVRPLTEDMLHYARADTHYLLYIYDRLRNELLEKSRHPSPFEDVAGTSEAAVSPSPQSAMRVVLARSEQVALRMYVREWTDRQTGAGPYGWKNAIGSLLGKDKVQTASGTAFIVLHIWRDEKARALDEAPQYVLSNAQLARISTAADSSDARISNLAKSLPDAYREEIKSTIQEAKSRWEQLSRQMVDQGASGSALAVLEAAQGSITKSKSPLPGTSSTELLSQVQVSSTEEDDSDLWGTTTGADLQSSMAASSTASDLAEVSKAPRQRQQPTHLDSGGLMSTSDLFGDAAAPTITRIPPSQAPVHSAVASDLFGISLGASRTNMTEALPSLPTDGAPTSDLFGSLPISKPTKPQSAFAAVKSAIDKDLFAQSRRSAIGPSRQTIEPVAHPETAESNSFGKAETTPAVFSPQHDVQAEPSSREREEETKPENEGDAVSDGEEGAPSDVVDEYTGEAVVRVKAKGKRRKGDSAVRRKAKKAKKSKKGTTSGDAAESSTLRKQVDDFDYSSVPSLLDAPSSTGRGEKRKRRKERGGGGITTETFGQVAKDPSAPKGGNKSMTFG